MEQKKSKGGKRPGAGRKPLGTAKKETITMYVEKRLIFKFGNKDKLKERLEKFISDFGGEKIEFVKTTPESFNGEKNMTVVDETALWPDALSFDKMKSEILTQNPANLKSFEQWKIAKTECETTEDWEKIKSGIDAAPNLSQKQKDLLIKYL